MGLVLLTVLAYSPTFLNDFQYAWDDQWQVLDYEFVQSHSFHDLAFHFTHFHLGQYMPVNTLLYILIYKLFGFNPSAFHAASLVVHCANVMLVFTVLSKILLKVKPNWKTGRAKGFSVLGSLVFAIHPLQVESVAWISASKVVLYTLFVLLGLRTYLKYVDSRKVPWLFVMAFCYLLAYGSKEQAIIFPLNLLALDYILGRFRPARTKRQIKKVLIEKVPFFALAVLLYAFSISNDLGQLNIEGYPLHQRAMFAMSSFMDYVFRSVAPVKLYYFYFFPIERGEPLPVYFYGYIVLILICAAFLWYNYKKNNRLVIFGFLLFFINIVLVLHIVPMPRKMITADRYMYLSLVGLGTMLAWFVTYIYTKYRRWSKFLALGVAIWFLFLGGYSFIRTREWKDSGSIKQNVKELIEKRKAEGLPAVDNPLENTPNEKK